MQNTHQGLKQKRPNPCCKNKKIHTSFYPICNWTRVEMGPQIYKAKSTNRQH